MSKELLTTLGVVAFIALVGNRLVAALVTPIYERFKWDKFSILFVSWILTGALVFLSNANLFAGYFDSALVGKILTAIVAGGGANFLHDIFDSAPKV